MHDVKPNFAAAAVTTSVMYEEPCSTVPIYKRPKIRACGAPLNSLNFLVMICRNTFPLYLLESARESPKINGFGRF